VDEQNFISAVWRDALAIIQKYPLATILPAAVLGALAEAPAYLIADHHLLNNALTYLTAAFAYYLYLAYAEGIAEKAEQRMDRIASRDMLSELRRAMPFVPRVLLAALVTLSLASAAIGLLVVPGVWLFTRWALSTPVICKERLGPVVALRRSNELVGGRFWFVLGTATLAFALEEALVHAGASAGFLVTGSHTWAEWIGGSMVAALVIPLAAFTTSIAYSRVAKPAEPIEGS